MFRRIVMSITLLLTMVGLSLAEPTDTVQVTDASINVGDNIIWDKDTLYILNGYVYVESTATLNIQAGTIIKGVPGAPGTVGALIISRGARIYAQGTAQNPIIFTSTSDNTEVIIDIPFNARGLWGGVLILGKSTMNSTGGTGHIEGIPVGDVRADYGGINEDDTSGVFRYVSIRHGGSILGANNEINGLTMGAVGRGTIIEYVEVWANADDGFEWFGGTVNTKYLISAFNDDDGFDTDEGIRGKHQYWFVIQDSTPANSGSEMDGGTVPEDSTPYASPEIWNATYIGAGPTGTNTSDWASNIRDNGGAKYYNSLFLEFRRRGVQIEDLGSGKDSRERLDSMDIIFKHDMFYNFGLTDSPDSLFPQAFVRTYMTDTAQHNRFGVNPMLNGISRKQNGGLDPRLKPASLAFSDVAVPGDPYFDNTGYIGAFGQVPTTALSAGALAACDQLWLAPWSFTYRSGVMKTYLSGDANGSGGNPGLPDIISLVNHVFKGAAAPDPLCRGNANGVFPVNLSDIIYLVNYVFKGGTKPIGSDCCI